MTTIRVHNIHLAASKEEILQYFNRDSKIVTNFSLDHSHDDRSKKVATITFSRASMSKAALTMDSTILSVPSGTSRIGVDDHFRGFTVIAGGMDPHNPDVDIIAIHGLNGHAFNTWTRDHRSVPGGVMWLRDLLPEQVPKARIMVYGYNASLVSDASTSRIQEHARLFVQSLQDFRRNDNPKRRVIFICHSLGGILLKQALVYIRNEPEYMSVQSITYAILFLGTPHNGSGAATVGAVLANIARVTFKSTASQVLEALETNSNALLDLTMSFKPLHVELKLTSFCEQLPMSVGSIISVNVGVVVDRRSAILGVANEVVIPVNADHSTICKYTGVGDEVYKLVLAQIKNFAEQATVGRATKRAVEEGTQNVTPPQPRRTRSPLTISSTLENMPATDENGHPHDNYTPVLIAASIEGNQTHVQMLLDAGANVNGVNAHGFTALIPAAQRGHLTVVNTLLNAGANVNHATDQGWTALHTASIHGQEDVVRRLLSVPGLNKYAAENYDRCTALQAAAQCGHARVVRLLLQGIGTGAVERDACGRSLLTAATNCHIEIVRMLLDAGASMEFANDDGFTPLQCAAQGGNLGLVELFLARGANPNAANDVGFTPLHSAALHGHADVVKRLLEAGADPMKTNKDGIIALHAAAQHDDKATFQYLLDAMKIGN